jgi:hypothetical protein
MGLETEAVAVAQSEFDKRPNYETALKLVGMHYDPAAMNILQTGSGKHDFYTVVTILNRAMFLATLAVHINELEQRT